MPLNMFQCNIPYLTFGEISTGTIFYMLHLMGITLFELNGFNTSKRVHYSKTFKNTFSYIIKYTIN